MSNHSLTYWNQQLASRPFDRLRVNGGERFPKAKSAPSAPFSAKSAYEARRF